MKIVIACPLFQLGQMVATPGAIAACEQIGTIPAEFIARHAAGDFGDLDAHDLAVNMAAMADGKSIFSVYRVPGKDLKFWVITEGDRSVTTVLLPEEY